MRPFGHSPLDRGLRIPTLTRETLSSIMRVTRHIVLHDLAAARVKPDLILGYRRATLNPELSISPPCACKCVSRLLTDHITDTRRTLSTVGRVLGMVAFIH
jgi:hypothetical protein